MVHGDLDVGMISLYMDATLLCEEYILHAYI